jgi:hypothetical protein
VDPDARWKLWQDWLGRDSTGRTIYAEVVEMLAFRQVWWGFAAIWKQAPAEAQKHKRAGSFQSGFGGTMHERWELQSVGRLTLETT